MSATPYPVLIPQIPVEDRPAGVETESEDGIYSTCGSGVDYSRESEQNYSESEKDTNGSSLGRYTEGSGSGISDVVFDNEGRVRGPEYKERTVTSARGTSEEEWEEEEESHVGFAGEGEVTIREEQPGGSQQPGGTDQPERALRSKGPALAIQLGEREAAVEVTASAWVPKGESTRNTILRGETEGSEHGRHKDDLDVQLDDGSLKTLTVGHEDDLSTPVPQSEVEKNQREPVELTGISGAATDEDSQEVYEQLQTEGHLPVGRLSTPRGRDIREPTTKYEVVEQTETPCRDPRDLGGEATPVARQLQFDFTVGKETGIKGRKKDYGKRKRGSDQVINYEVESAIIATGSAINTGRNKEQEEFSGLREREEVRTRVTESSTEGEGGTVRRALSLEPPPRLVWEEDQEVTETAIEEDRSSEFEAPESEADSNGVEKTIVRRETTLEADFVIVETVKEVDLAHQVSVLEEESGSPKQVGPKLKEPQPEEQEEGLWETEERTLVTEKQPESSWEKEEGAEGASTPEPAATGDVHNDQTVSINEKEEEPLSKEGIITKKTLTLIPKALEESVKTINSDLNIPESEEDVSEGETNGEERGIEVTTHSATGGAETDVFGHPVTEVNYTFGKQESVGELYQKVLDAIDWYQQEKAARTQGQEYKAQTAVVGEGEDEIGRQSLSPTTELEEKVERLINRAERANSERTRNLQRIQQEAQQVLGTIEGTRWEETRWKFYELSKESTGINEAGQTPKQVIETDKGRIRTESGGSYQGEAGSETSREELKSRKETEKVDTEEILEPYLKTYRG